jgi:hypothetical protein
MTTTAKHLPAQWDATPYGMHWSFAYSLANKERDEYDFTVEFHESIDEPEQTAVISLIEAAPNVLAALEYVTATLKLRHIDEASDDKVDEALQIGREAMVLATGSASSAEEVTPATPAQIDVKDTDFHDMVNGHLAERRQIAIIWSIEDVQEVRPDLTEDQCWEALAATKRYHDATIGINWDALRCHAALLFGTATDETEGQ